MRINLFEIPEEGLHFKWTSETRELNQALADLVGNLPHEAEFFIRPLNSKNYELSGSIKTQVPEVCSRCGTDFNLAIDESFRGILIPRQEDDRTGKYSKANHVSEMDGGPEVFEFDNGVFDMGEHVHEMVALATPYRVLCPEDAVGICSACKTPKKDCQCNYIYDEELPAERPNNPFGALKNFKLN